MKVFHIPGARFFDNMTSLPVQCYMREYSDKYGILDLLWKIHPNRGRRAAALYIPMWRPYKDIFYLTIFQDSLYASKLTRIGGYLY